MENSFSEKEQKMNELAEDILRVCRNSLIMNLRFLDTAVSRLKFIPMKSGTIAVDGVNIGYNAEYIFKLYKEDKTLVTRAYLHMVMHCIFKHPFLSTIVDMTCWDLACDIAVENAINELNLGYLVSDSSPEQDIAINFLKSKVNLLTAEKLYRYFLDGHMAWEQMQTYEELFKVDDHFAWYLPPEESDSHNDSQNDNDSTPETENTPEGQSQDQESPTNEESDDEQENISEDENSSGEESSDESESTGEDESSSDEDGESEDAPHEENNLQTDNQSSDEQDHSEDDNDDEPQDEEEQGDESSNENLMQKPSQQTSEDWDNVSHKAKVEMESFSGEAGDEAGSLLQNLKEVNRERYDYTKFLKKFAVHGEMMKVNDDEYDYIFYTYGLKLFKNLPLIEPLEYKEVKRIKEFIIAIDTSGSVQGDKVQAFLNKTYNILKSTESFFSKINLHIIQCDAKVQEVAKISCQEEFDEYIDKMTFKGFGGTDFRPVFTYVDELRKKGEFINLKGLIYFTDGEGKFPEKRTDYETAFVFIEDELKEHEVPPWIIKLVLRAEEI